MNHGMTTTPRTCGMQRANPMKHGMPPHPRCPRHRHRRQWHHRAPRRNGSGGMNGRDGMSGEMATPRNGSTTPMHGSPIGTRIGNPGKTPKHHGPHKRRPNPMEIIPRVVGSPITMVPGGRSSIELVVVFRFFFPIHAVLCRFEYITPPNCID